MSYELITKYNSRNFTPSASVPATYGRQRTIDSITIHWWGLPEWNATFEGTTDFLCTNNKPTSAHEVIEAGRVAVIVNHGDASWAAGNAVGNATSIHLELNPRANDADYATTAERIRDIRAMHGKDLPLIPHRTWQATMCPGHYDLDRLDRMASESTITTQGTITPITSEEDELNSAQDGALGTVFARTNQAPAAGLIASQGDINIVLARMSALEDAVLTALGKPVTEPSAVLIKGDQEATVYAWDGGTGYRALDYGEFSALMASGAELRTVEQAAISGVAK